jgi:hypothetical protein
MTGFASLWYFDHDQCVCIALQGSHASVIKL